MVGNANGIGLVIRSDENKAVLIAGEGSQEPPPLPAPARRFGSGFFRSAATNIGGPA